MDDKLSSLKLKLYLLFSADADQGQDQRQLPVKEKKDGSFTGLLIYISGLTIGSNTCGVKINPAMFR